MATGDLLQAEIMGTPTRRNGKVLRLRFEGVTSTANLASAFGYVNGVPGANTPTLTVTSQGFDGSRNPIIATRTVRVTRIDLQPATTNLDAAIVGGNTIDVYCVLSNYVYVDDKVGGGANVDPVLNLPAGAFTFGAGGTVPNTASAAFTVTNNSTQPYQKPTGVRWLKPPGETAKGSSYEVEIFGFHPDGVACVEFTATEETSGFIQSAIVNQMSLSSQSHVLDGMMVKPCGYKWSINGNPGSWTSNRLIATNAKVYPKIGNASSVFDTAVGADGTAQPHPAIGPFTYLNDFGNLNTTVYATVNASAPGPGAVSTTSAGADAAKFPTLAAAIAAIKTYRNGLSPSQGANVNGAVIQVQGTVPMFTSATDGANFRSWLNIVPHPTDPQTALITGSGSQNNYTGMLRIAVNVAGSSTFLFAGGDGTGSTSSLWINCATITVVGALAPFYAWKVIYMTAPAGTAPLVVTGAAQFRNFGGNSAPFALLRGVEGPSNADADATFYCFVATRNIIPVAVSSTTPNFSVTENALMLCGYGQASRSLADNTPQFSAHSTTKAGAIVNTLISYIGTGGEGVLNIAADASTSNPVNNFHVYGSTILGGRANLSYNDAGSTENVREFWTVKDSIFWDVNVKGSRFGTPNANRVGNVAMLNGVGCENNHYIEGANAANFPPDFAGLMTTFGSSSVESQPGFVNEKSFRTAGRPVSITRSGATATVTDQAHGASTGDSVVVSGCAQTQYNGTFTITVVDANTYTYAVAGSPASPATGAPIAKFLKGRGDYRIKIGSAIRGRATATDTVCVAFDAIGFPRRGPSSVLGRGTAGAIESPADGRLVSGASNITGTQVTLTFDFDRSPDLDASTLNPALFSVTGSTTGAQAPSSVVFGAIGPTTLEVIATFPSAFLAGETLTASVTAGAARDALSVQQIGGRSGVGVTNNIVAPTIVSAEIDASGLMLRLVWSEAVDTVLGATRPTVYVNGTPRLTTTASTDPSDPFFRTTRHAIPAATPYGAVVTADIAAGLVVSQANGVANLAATGVAAANLVPRPAGSSSGVRVAAAEWVIGGLQR